MNIDMTKFINDYLEGEGITPDKALPAMGDIFTSLGKETYKIFQKLGNIQNIKILTI